MGLARAFSDLDVYQLALREAAAVFEATRRFPREERFALVEQVVRSSRAVGALIAEAWARRKYPLAFSEKLYQAMAEAMETQAWLDHALACGYLTPGEHGALRDAWDRIGAMLHRMIQKSADFGHRLR